MNKPEQDGVTHINVYSRGRTQLGRLLSNFAHTPFEFDGWQFASVEAWWYWRKCKDPRLLDKHGFDAKNLGRMYVLLSGQLVGDPTPDELLKVYQAKVRDNPHVAKLLRDNVLPFDHYFVGRSGQRIETGHRWTGELWTSVSDGLRKEKKSKSATSRASSRTTLGETTARELLRTAKK